MHTHIIVLCCTFDLSCGHPDAGFLPASPTGRLIVENYTADYLHLPGVFRLSFNASSDIGSGGKEGLLQPAAELTAFVVRISDMELESDTYFMLVSGCQRWRNYIVR